MNAMLLRSEVFDNMHIKLAMSKSCTVCKQDPPVLSMYVDLLSFIFLCGGWWINNLPHVSSRNHMESPSLLLVFALHVCGFSSVCMSHALFYSICELEDTLTTPQSCGTQTRGQVAPCWPLQGMMDRGRLVWSQCLSCRKLPWLSLHVTLRFFRPHVPEHCNKQTWLYIQMWRGHGVMHYCEAQAL